MVTQFDVNVESQVRKVVPRTFKICPICGYKGKFEDYGSPVVRTNSKCPECGSTERIRLIWLYLVGNNLPYDSHKIVHIMPEQPVRYKLKGIPSLKYSLGGLTDINDLLSKDGSCDFIIANNVLDRVDDLSASLDDIKQTLKKDGSAMLNVNIVDDKEQELAKTPRKFGSAYFDLLSEAGFEAKRFDTNDLISPTLAYLFGIGTRDYLIIAKKK